jgi:hypothetical protein
MIVSKHRRQSRNTPVDCSADRMGADWRVEARGAAAKLACAHVQLEMTKWNVGNDGAACRPSPRAI